MVLSLPSKDLQFCRKDICADKQYLLFASVLYLHCCTLFLGTGVFEMPIKSKLCCFPFSHLIPCLVCALYNPNRRQLFSVGLSRRGLANPFQETSSSCRNVAQPPLTEGKKKKGCRRVNHHHGELLPPFYC